MEMNVPGFWVNRLSAPDEVVMDERQIQEFNQEIGRQELRNDIAGFPAVYSGKSLKDILTRDLKEISSAGYFSRKGKKTGKAFFSSIKSNFGFERVPDQVQVRFAVVVVLSDQRILPVQEILTKKPLDIDFDELQNSSLDINTPVAVLWQSADNYWSYCVGPSSSGWVLTRNLAWCGQDTIRGMRSTDFVVAIESKADVYADKERTRFLGFVRMGVRFEVRNFAGDLVEVALPIREEQGNLKFIPAYVRSKDVHRGYLPYTRRVIIEQAFELLNTPYGWGGSAGEQDCSQFLQEIFATVGIDLPRNSEYQAKAGKALYEFKKDERQEDRIDKVITQAQAGLSLLYMKGHIMLYLGAVDKRPYAIHDTRGFRQKTGFKERTLVINKVTVSDLELGAGSKKGSLLNRLKCIRMIDIGE